MASITYDGQSFMLDGRRIWIVSGSIHYSRVPKDLWQDRIHAAKSAGLNTIETPVFWARHEARQGQLDFKGDNDIKRFVQLIGEAGLYCILRPGPFVGSGWDMGGLPPWLMGIANIRLRANSQPFLECCSRYITALAGQVRDLQATASGGGGGGGPIILLQNEHAWTCGHDVLAAAYLGELSRYFRESGFNVPLINSNDLWQSLEGQIDCWTGFADMLAQVRQLGTVRAEKPRLVIDFKVGRSDVWGREPTGGGTAATVLRRLVEVLAAGGQYNISPFFGGTNFGFSGGRLAGMPEGYITASSDRGAPLSETGEPGASYEAVRRISTFASRFGRVLANLAPGPQAVILHPGAVGGATDGKKSGGGASLSVVHASGSQGGVVFVFGDESGAAKSQAGAMLLPDGSALPIDLGSQPAAWYLFDTRLTGRSQLDYTNLSTLGLAGRTLVCFGPAGFRGIVSINGSPLEIEVPRGKPAITEHEQVTLVVASEEQIGTVWLDGETVLLGVAGVKKSGEVIPLEDAKHYTRVTAEGAVTTHKVLVPGQGKGAASNGKKRHGRLRLGEWESASAGDYTSGESARYATVAGPASLASLGAPYGYGWYRVKFKSSAPPRKHHVVFPGSGDRLHVSLDGEFAGIAGRGPGAGPEVGLQLKRGVRTLVVLAENLGRAAAGLKLGEPAGLVGHAWSARAMRLEKPRLVAADPIDVLAFTAPVWHVHKGDVTDAARMSWTIQHRRRTPLLLRLAEQDGPGVLVLNGQPALVFERGARTERLLEPEKLSKGNNLVQVTMLGSTEAHGPSLMQSLSVHECEEALTGKGEWAFARWEPPGKTAFHKTARAGGGHQPVWWRCEMEVDDLDEPVLLDATGMTKGQIYVNGRHLSRYWVATAEHRHVPPQVRYFIPRPWLKVGEANELMLFDEHGGNPARCRLVEGRDVATVEG